MAAVLGMYLKNAGHNVMCESAGVGESACKPGPAAKFAVAAATRLGLDISQHKKRGIGSVRTTNYGLIVCANDEIAEKVIEEGRKADDESILSKVYNAQVPNPWPVQFQEQYDETFERILVAMSRVMKFYFPDPASFPGAMPPSRVAV
jgi:protein-tyrosine-phosphatase